MPLIHFISTPKFNLEVNENQIDKHKHSHFKKRKKIKIKDKHQKTQRELVRREG